MIADNFRQAKKPVFNLNELKLTKPRRVTLLALMESSNRRIYYTSQKEWGTTSDKDKFGAKVVELTPEGLLKSVFKTHGRHVNNLFNAGLLEIDRDIKGLHPRIVVFKLAIKGMELRALRSKALFGHVVRVTKVSLNELAQSHGLKLDYNSTRGIFEVEPIQAPENSTSDNKSYIFQNSRGEPVTRYNDMSMAEWDDFFFQKVKSMALNPID